VLLDRSAAVSASGGRHRGGPIGPPPPRDAGESGAISPRVTTSRSRVALPDVIADVERMLKRWQVHVTTRAISGSQSERDARVDLATRSSRCTTPSSRRGGPHGGQRDRATHPVWLGAKFGLPADSTASFTSGGAEANLSALVVALTRAFPALRRTRTRSASRAADRLPDGGSPPLVQQDRPHDRAWTPRDPDGGDRRRLPDGSR